MRADSILGLWYADYEELLSRKNTESPQRRKLLALPRLIANPALRAVLLLRVANASPRPTWFIWRNMFVKRFSMDWTGRAEIGPGFTIPHPLGICIPQGAKIGRNVMIGHNVTLAGDVGQVRPTIGDGVRLFPGSMVVGDTTIGEDSVVSANCVVTHDVPPRKLVTAKGVIPLAVSPKFAQNR